MSRTRTTAPSVALFAGTLAASVAFPASGCAADGISQVDIYDRSERRALETYRHDGRRYVIGEPGNEYAIRVRNCTGGRVLAVVSVDGVNVVTGDTASPEQAGYVIEPGGYVNIQGWRKSLYGTAAFYFSEPGDAYASRTGRPDDLGVIGVAMFRERATPRGHTSEASAQEAARSLDRAEAGMPRMEPSLGTGHGRREYSPVERVEFERASREPDQRVVIRYDRRENLVAMGVLPPARRWHEPDPFPAQLGFVPDP